MIRDMHIKNLATIEELHLSLDGGLNILTGETGAGKSLFLEAFAWLTGLRADRGMIREGKDYASVELVLDNIPEAIQERLVDQGWEDTDSLIVFRQISRTGSSKIILNNRHVTLGFLKEVMQAMLLLHSQNQSIELLKKSYHLMYLDSMSDEKLQNAISNYKSAWSAWQHSLADYEAFCANLITATEENFLRFQWDELDGAVLDARELTALEEEQQVLQNGREIAEKGQRVYEQIHGPQSILSLSDHLRHDLRDLSRFYGDLAPFLEEIETLTDSLLEISSFIQSTILDLELNPRRMEEVENRLQVYYDMTRKYDMTLPELLIYKEKIKNQLDNYALATEGKERLKELCREKEERAWSSARELSMERNRVGQWLSHEIDQKIHHMEMHQAQFDVRIQPLEALSASGMDDVEFHIQTNLGSAFMPLRKIASGGERSRILLALLIAQGKSDTLKIMVFDEIDAGLSGKAALRMAEVLNDLAVSYQIVCVTHQPQVAAFADHYYQLQKTTRDQHTYTQVKKQTEEDRVHAIAQLVSGDKVEKSGYAYAREILHYAQERKEHRS